MMASMDWQTVHGDRAQNVLRAAVRALRRSIENHEALSRIQARAVYLLGIVEQLQAPPRFPLEPAASHLDAALAQYAAAARALADIEGIDGSEQGLDRLGDAFDECDRCMVAGHEAMALVEDSLPEA